MLWVPAEKAEGDSGEGLRAKSLQEAQKAF